MTPSQRVVGEHMLLAHTILPPLTRRGLRYVISWWCA